MSPAEIEYRLARSLDHFKVRRTQGEHPDPEDYLDELGDAYDEFLEILDLEQMLDEVLDPSPEDALPREFGPYTLLRELGRGAVGIVYEGVHRELGRHEAVKILRTGFDEEGTALDRFRQEAKVLARVRHDHIVEIYGAGQVDGRPYYAMSLLEGRTLSQVARGGELPSFEDLCGGLAHVADALQMLHEQGVVHRDVKPSNIIVTDDGRMVLADFGLARSLQDERITRTGQALGTPLYMSPEQILARRDDIDGRTDVYGLGATLYEVCAGRPVFQTDDLRQLLQMVIRERPAALRKVALDVPAPCADIAMKALEKKRRDRYQSAGDMRDDLLAFAQGERVRGRPVSTVRHGLRRVRTYALPIAAVLLVALAAGLWYANRPGELSVTSQVPDVAVFVAGRDRGQAPLTVELDSGHYDVLMRHPKFEDFVVPVQVESGDKTVIPYALPRPLDPDDADTLAMMGTGYGVALGGYAIDGRNRDVIEGVPAQAVLPGGPVRPSDLGDYFLEIGPEPEVADARLFFDRTRDGVTGTIYEEAFGESNMSRRAGTIPMAVRAQLAPGDVVTWGLRVPGLESKCIDQTFTVVGENEKLDAELARLDDALAEHHAPLRAAFRAQVLLNAGLVTAAFREASRGTQIEDPTGGESLEAQPGEDLAWLVMGAAIAEIDQARASELFGKVLHVRDYDVPEELREAWEPSED